MPKSNYINSHRQLNSDSLYKQTGRNPLSEDVCFSVENHELIYLQNSTICQAHSRVSECDGRLIVRATQIQSTEWSLHPQMFKWICQMWFTPHVDLFASC